MPTPWMESSLVEARKQTRSVNAVDPRLSAARTLKQVLQGHSLTEVIPAQLEGITDPRDQALVKELSFGVMRWYQRLDALLMLLLKKPLKDKDRDIKSLLLMGLYQLLYLRVADYAAVHATAAVANKLRKPWAVGLINGVLRECQRRRAALLAQLEQDPVAHDSMPAWMLSRLKQDWPQDWQQVVSALNARPPMILRVNCRQTTRDDYRDRLLVAGIEATNHSLARLGLVLTQPVDVTSLPGFDQGMVSVQDAGAQLAAELLELKPGQQVLDVCAAPGGKTGHILEIADDLRLTAIDVDPTRLQRVMDNLQRLSLEADCCVGDAAHPTGDWASRRYDRILLDVPCSATGVIRRHPDIKYLRQAADIAGLVTLQGRILRAVWPLLKPGGMLLYVTCSILQDENEQQVASFLSQQSDASELPIDATWGLRRSVGRQILPDDLSMDGFFYARLSKQGG